MADIGIVQQVDINKELEEAYLSYAMSVIVSRALPDVRDGLKPVHRRILYAMYDMGLHPERPHKKSARIVGEVLGKYHPHGDSAVYDAMVRMAQDFSMRYLLVDGQGNFGSVDGDNAAAMRYTEARLAKAAMELLIDINKDTVNFSYNFDGTLKEPDVLPTTLPHLLINGADGIAVGMSTKIPPHNIGEICDALDYMLEHWHQREEISVEDLMRFVQGPDFPTGGLVYRYRNDQKNNNTDTILNAYATGRGRLVVQAKTHIEEMSRNRNRLVITELPYQTNKSNLIERIANLAREGRIEGITDMRDESDRRGMRIVIELTRNVQPTDLLNQLFKLTPLRQTFGVIMLALVNGEPRLLPLKRALQLFIEHRQVVIRRRSEYDLQRAENRAHILEGLRIALSNLDDVIQTIRRSQRVDTAKKNLIKRFAMTTQQAQAVLDMRLARLAALERKKVDSDYQALREKIDYLEELLENPAKILAVIRNKLKELKERYNDPRRTLIITEAEYTGKALQAENLIPDGDIIITISSKGEIQRIMNAARKLRSGKGYEHILTANNRYDLLLISKNGQAWRTNIHQLPEKTGRSRGESLTQRLSGWERQHRVAVALDVPTDEETLAKGYLLVVTRSGRVVRVSASEIKNLYVGTLLANVEEDDEVIWSGLSQGTDELLLVSAQGQTIRFKEEDVRPTGIGVQGVRGIKLGKKDDVVIGAGLARHGSELLVVSSQGISKRVLLKDYSAQGRYGKGLRTMSVNEATGPLAAAAVVDETDRLTFLTSNQRVALDAQVRQIALATRYQSGTGLEELPEKHRITGLLKWGTCSAWPTSKKEETTAEEPTSTSEAEKNEQKSKNPKSKRRKSKRKSSRNKGQAQQLALELFEMDENKTNSNGSKPK
ncbi:MAG: DNA gyrase subunit A [Ardenticatenaceae bacterium]